MKVTLTIHDEVNCKLVGLTTTDRKKLVDKFKYEIPGARYQPACRLGRWDGKQSFFQLGGSTYVNLLVDILPWLESQGYDVELEDLRSYPTTFEFQPFSENTFSDKTWPAGHVMEGKPIVFRDYQVDAINNFLDNLQSVQEISTGSGKTLITAALSNLVEPYGRSIIIVPNKSLVAQTLADYENLGLDVGVYFGDRKDLGKTHTICTWQSLNILLKNTKDSQGDITINEFIQDVVCVIIDECHGAKSAALVQLMTGPFAHIPIRWGLTGTVPKEDYAGVSIVCSLGPVVGRLTAAELQDAGHLAQCHVNIVQLIDHVEYRDYQSELKYLVSTDARLEYIAKLVQAASATGNTLLLVDRLETGQKISAMIPGSVFISGATKSADRQEEYNEIREATGKILIATYGIAAVGINIPRIFNLVMLEPGKSFVRVIQSIGRGIRKADDKDSVMIWDITSTCKFAKRHLTARKKFYAEAKYPFTIEKLDWK